jgi:hypothetical protein
MKYRGSDGRGGVLALVVVFLLLSVPVIYVLSTGPVALMLSRTEGGAEVWNAAYCPLQPVYETRLGKYLGNYVNWWMPPSPLTTAQEGATP